MVSMRGLYGFEGVPDPNADPSSKSKYERRFKKWNMRKNLTREEWITVGRKVKKRKLHGKESEVYVDGALIPKRKVRKETMRNSFVWTGDRTAQGNLPN